MPKIPRRYFPYENLRKEDWVGAKVIGSRIVSKFLEAFYRLRAWDAWKDPTYFDRLLVAPEKRPADVILVGKLERI